MNAMLKRKTDYKQHELPVFIEKVRELIQEQNQEAERSVIVRGKYQLREQYRSFEVPESKWFVMKVQQRRKHLPKVHSTEVVDASRHDCIQPSDLSVSPLAPEEYNVPEQASSNLSVLCVDLERAAQHVNVPFKRLEGLWDKPSKIVNSNNSILLHQDMIPKLENGVKL